MAGYFIYDPFDQWNRMDNYIKDFLLKNPAIDSETKNKIKHFLFQYLAKVANIDRREAAVWGRDISPWKSGRNEYQRGYHNDNPLLKSIEFEIVKLMELNKGEVLVLNDQELLEGYRSFGREFKGQNVLMIPAPSEYEKSFEMIVRRGYTPSLQDSAAAAVRLNLEAENPTYEFPLKECFLGGFKEFIEHSVYISFKQFSENHFSGSAIVELLDGFSSMIPDPIFQEKQIRSLLQDSYGRVLHFLSESMRVPFACYADLHKFENFMELIYEEMIFWLMITEPYPQGEFERLVQQIIPPSPFFRAMQSGMTAFSDILKVVLKEELTVLYYDDCYYECIVSIKGENSFPIQFPDYNTSLDKTIEKLKGRKIDLLFVDFHNNFLCGKMKTEKHDVKAIMLKLKPHLSDAFAVVIDNTIGFLKSEEIDELLKAFPERTIIIHWSHQKFDMFGVDKLNGGSYAVYSRDESLLSQFRNLKGGEIDSVSRQGLTHFFTFGVKKLEERRAKIFSNTCYVYERIDPRIEFVVKKLDPISFSVDLQQEWDTDEEIAILKEFEKRGVPIMTRLSFGFNTLSSTLIRFEGLRISIGMEDQKYLDQFIAAFNSIFSIQPVTPKRVGEQVDVYLNRT